MQVPTLPPHLMTVMFADITGSARLYGNMDDAAVLDAVNGCLEHFRHCIARHQGRTVKIVGDELLAVFDLADDACLAAIDMQIGMTSLPLPGGVRPGLRIGLHIGMLSELSDSLNGIAVVSTARIAGLAAPTQILLSDRLPSSLSDHLRDQANSLPDLPQQVEGASHFLVHELLWCRHKNKEMGKKPLLLIQYREQSFVLEATSSALSIGREHHNGLLIEDHKTSRKHALIDPRPEGFFFIDKSTNGSFLTFDQQAEYQLRHQEILLHGKGQISFGSPGKEAQSGFISFELR